jgi:hypothetical protein
MPSDLKVYLGSAQQAPNGEAFELFKLQPDDTYAKVVYAVVDKAVPIPVVFDPATTLTVTLGDPMYSVATPTQDGLMSSMDKVKLDGIVPATESIDGLLSKNDKTKLNVLTQTFRIDSNGNAVVNDNFSFKVVGGAYTQIDKVGVQRVGNGSYASEQGWRSLNGLHFQYNPTTGIATNPWVKIGNMPAVGEGLMLLEVFTATDVNYPSFNVAQACIKRFQDSFSMSAELTCTNQDAVAIYVGFNFNGDIFLKSTAVWGSVASYQIKFLNTSFTPQTPEIFTGTVIHEIGTPAGFLKSKRVTS